MVGSEIYENELPTIIKEDGDKLGKWLFVEDAAEMLEVSKRTIFQYLKEGKLKGIKSRKRRLVATGSLLVFLLKQKAIELNDIRSKELARETLFKSREMN